MLYPRGARGPVLTLVHQHGRLRVQACVIGSASHEFAVNLTLTQATAVLGQSLKWKHEIVSWLLLNMLGDSGGRESLTNGYTSRAACSFGSHRTRAPFGHLTLENLT